MRMTSSRWAPRLCALVVLSCGEAAPPKIPEQTGGGAVTATAGEVADGDGVAEPVRTSPPAIAGPAESIGIALVPGLTLTSVHRFPEGDRENVVRVEGVSPEGLVFTWYLRQQEKSGETFEHRFERVVRSSDLASAPRLDHLFFTRPGRSQSPGYTSFLLSRAAYARVRGETSIPFTVISLSSGPSVGELTGLLRSKATLKGTLSLATTGPQAMAILLNGRRVSVPVVPMRGKYAYLDQRQESEYWVLADTASPLLLRIVTGTDTFQTVRIDLPEHGAREEGLEERLERECRVELPGIYFAFASAQLEPASTPTLAAVAAMLGRHGDWSLAIEGHTDSIGDPESNQALSLRRAEAVRGALVERHGVVPDRLRAAGFGATRPREPNATIEGRARNRRVELVRDCPGGG